MQQIQAYKTSDGKVFEDSKEAKQHQALLDFKAWYEDGHELYGDRKVDFNDLISWLDENFDVVKTYFTAQ